jgi:hypothetical protein
MTKSLWRCLKPEIYNPLELAGGVRQNKNFIFGYYKVMRVI